MTLALYDKIQVVFKDYPSGFTTKQGKVFCINNKNVEMKIDNSNCKLNFNIEDVFSIKKIN